MLISYGKVNTKFKHNFLKYNNFVKQSYNTHSIMNFDNKSFSIDKKDDVIVTKETEGPNELDIKNLNILYSCTIKPKYEDKHHDCPYLITKGEKINVNIFY